MPPFVSRQWKGVVLYFVHSLLLGCGRARKLRVEYAGAIYQVMNRGDRRELVFLDDEDRQRFLTTFGEACTKTGWQVHADCLMPLRVMALIDDRGVAEKILRHLGAWHDPPEITFAFPSTTWTPCPTTITS